MEQKYNHVDFMEISGYLYQAYCKESSGNMMTERDITMWLMSQIFSPDRELLMPLLPVIASRLEEHLQQLHRKNERSICHE